MRKGLAMTLVAALCAAMVGCNGGGSADNGTGSSTSTGGGSGAKLKIAVIPKGSTHEYWKGVQAGANAAGKELGVDIVFKGPEKEDDKDSQISTVESFVTQKVSGIVLAPLDRQALVPCVKQANDAKIPVLVIDSDLGEGAQIISTVATDNEKAGEMAGENLAKEIGGKGKVIMLRYMEGSASTEAREAGFLAAMKKFPNIQIVSDNQHAGATAESAQKASESLIQPLKQGDKLSIDGIYTPNESSTFGMLRALEDANLAGKVKLQGFDSSDKLIEGLQKGFICGLIVQNPYKMGYDGVKMIVASIKGQKVDSKEDTGATLVTKDNMDQPDVKKLIAPPSV